ncbi:MAG: hypothetical protein O2820_02870 [Planctomycetota bacterium]|nr:hypothetical protein [Planctomycetota bacterium]MDA1248145.1 hypothetical protein [Planctomycetota bacterium]
MADANEQTRRYREFLDLMPLTLALAGLPSSEAGRYYSEDQMETRIFTLRHAYKAARAFAKETVTK